MGDVLQLDELPPGEGPVSLSRDSAPIAVQGDGPVMRCLSDVPRTEVRWLRPAVWPLGKLSLLTGEPGHGKTTLLLDAIARVTRGDVWPEGGRAPLGDVVFLTAEDGLDDTIRPRCEAAGADLSRVHALTAIREGKRERSIVLSVDEAHLRIAMRQLRPKLVVIDPLTAYLGSDLDTHRDGAVRGVLGPLAKLAQDFGAAVVGIMHLNKRHDGSALHRVGGSIGFTAAARSVFLVAQDPQDRERRLFVPVKMNLAAHPDALAYRLAPGPDGSVAITWEAGRAGQVNADDLVGHASARQRPRDAAADALHDLLEDGPRLAREAEALLRGAGIKETTWTRAKKALGVRSYKRPDGWWWSLPGQGGQADPIDKGAP